MTPDEYADPATALQWVQSQVGVVAGRYGWDADALQAASADIADAYAQADAADWWGVDMPTFWETLTSYASAWPYQGASTLAGLFASAGQVQIDVDAQADAGSVSTIVGGTLTTTEADIAQAATDAADAAKPLVLRWQAWLVLALVAVGAVWIL